MLNDVCQRLISLAGQTPAATSVDAMERCIQLGALSDDNVYRSMVRFRNFILHRYDRVDVRVLVDMVNHRLTDFEQFRTENIELCPRRLTGNKLSRCGKRRLTF